MAWWLWRRHRRQSAGYQHGGASPSRQTRRRALTVLPGGDSKGPGFVGGGGPLMFPASQKGCGCNG